MEQVQVLLSKDSVEIYFLVTKVQASSAATTRKET